MRVVAAKEANADPGWLLAKRSTPVVLVVATLLFTISYASPFWARTDPYLVQGGEFLGVWRYCAASHGGGYNCNDFIDLGSYGDWLKAVQAFSTLVFFGLLGSVGIYGAYVFAGMDSVIMFACAMASTFLVVVFEVISVGVFAGEYTEYFTTRESSYPADFCRLAWAWYLAVFATVLTITAMVILFFDFIKNISEDDYD